MEGNYLRWGLLFGAIKYEGADTTSTELDLPLTERAARAALADKVVCLEAGRSGQICFCEAISLEVSDPFGGLV